MNRINETESPHAELRDAIYLDGMSEGNEIAQRDFKGVIKREMFKAEKVQMCLGYYFNDDPERVAKSIQTVCKVVSK